ncbi:enolase C-terminal domain-like protein [Cellulomonas sp. McL0617]|uniref:enolase C-terminal domain-like protein n=1 Tax=Cellulomonas sp. McL0617 TaxID=3415675 RepID=UPI003CECD04E
MTAVFEPFDVVDVRFPTSREHDGSDAMNPDPDYSAAYVVVRTSAGESGAGFVFTIGRGNEVAASAIRAVERLVVGLDVEETLADMGAFWRLIVHDSQLRWLGPEKGVVHMAIGAVVNAVWDLYAKREGKPLWQLLGELTPEQLVALIDFRHLSDALTPAEALEILTRGAAGKDARVAALLADGYPAYTTSAGWLGYSDAKVELLVKEALADGFTHLKLKVGADADDDERRLEMVRSLVGPDVLLSIDANQAWDVGEAIDTIGRLAPYGLYWVEEPTSPDDVAGHRAIAQAVAPVRVATGEHVANRVVFKQLLAAGAIDVCQIDACRVAGVNENVAILVLAAKYGVPVCPHAGGVGLCEVVQHLAMFDLVAVSGSTQNRWIEFVDHLHEHFVVPARVQGGRYLAPTLPGSGAELLPTTLIDYRYPDGVVWSDPQSTDPHPQGR